MKLEIKGTITYATPVESIGKQNPLFKMEVVVSKAPPTNEFGEHYGKTQHYIMQIIKNDQAAMPQHKDLLNKKVNAICYLNGYEYLTDNNIQYGLRLNLKELTFI